MSLPETPPDHKKDGDKKSSFSSSSGVAHELGLTNPLMYLSELATVSDNMLGNTPKPTDIDGLFITGMRYLNISQWSKAGTVFQEALEKAAKACKVKKPSKGNVEKLATACMCRGFIAACQSNLKMAHNLYKKSLSYWAALHGKDSPKLNGLKEDIAKIRSKGVKVGKEEGTDADDAHDHDDAHDVHDLSHSPPPESSTYSTSSTSVPLSASSPASPSSATSSASESASAPAH